MNYIYISKSTKDKFLSEIPKKNLAVINHSIILSYKMIKKTPKKWGMILMDKNKIIGICEMADEEEDGVEFMLITNVFVDENYRGLKLCNNLLRETILMSQKKKKSELVKVVIAGGMPVLKCMLHVFSELKYKIKKYSSDTNENIKKLKNITKDNAIKIERKNKSLDRWQTLFFMCK